MLITIQKTGIKDLQALRAIAIKTFIDSFASQNTEENMNHYVTNHLSEAQLEKEITNPESEFYFAMDEEKVIGYLKLNFGNAQTELKENKGIEIERIYVLQSYHGKEVGQMLYNKALEIASTHAAKYIWLGVWEKNPRAIRFYEKNGFKPFDKHSFRLGDDLQTDLMMRLELN